MDADKAQQLLDHLLEAIANLRPLERGMVVEEKTAADSQILEAREDVVEALNYLHYVREHLERWSR